MTFATRLIVCRLGFIGLCVLPTAVVCCWIALRSLSGSAGVSKEDWQREMTNQCGLTVEIGDVKNLRSGLARFTGVRLLDPETRELAAAVDQIDIASTAEGVRLSVTKLVIEAAQLGRVAHAIHERVLCGPVVTKHGQIFRLKLAPCDVLVRSGQCEQSLQLMGGELALSEPSAKLDFEFQLTGAEANQPMRFTATRHRAGPLAMTHWRLDTACSPLACRWSVGLLPELTRLGSECQFAGVMEWNQQPPGASGYLTGTLTGVDLDALVTEQFPHQLSGVATVQLERVLIDRGKLASLRGGIRAERGSISPGLIAAAAEHLGLEAGEAEVARESAWPVPFRQLVIDFDVSGQSLRLTGSTDGLSDGTLITGANGPILSAGSRHSVATVNLLRTLVPENGYQVPATRQTAALMGLLPVPDIASAKQAGPATHVPTRLLPASAESPRTAIRQPALR